MLSSKEGVYVVYSGCNPAPGCRLINTQEPVVWPRSLREGGGEGPKRPESIRCVQAGPNRISREILSFKSITKFVFLFPLLFLYSCKTENYYQSIFPMHFTPAFGRGGEGVNFVNAHKA